MNAAATGEILSPSQLNTLARDLLEGAFPQAWVEGELSGVARPSSGHLYFCLKDARGYAIVQHEDGRVVRSTTQAAPGDRVEARLADGTLKLTVR